MNECVFFYDELGEKAIISTIKQVYQPARLAVRRLLAMRSGSQKKGLFPRPIQLLLTFVKLLFERLIAMMHTLIKAPSFLWLEKQSAIRKRRAQPHMSIEETAAFVSGNVSDSARELALVHLAACDRCREMVAEIVRSETAVTGVDEPST